MKRSDLEHLIRAAAAVSDTDELVVIGSQSILGAFPDAPEDLLQSREAALYPLARPDLAVLIEGSIGELSPFDERFGYYVQGVGPETAILPRGWRSRLVRIRNGNTSMKTGWCLDPVDLAASKLAAGRDKDRDFVRSMLAHRLIDPAVLRQRLREMPLDPPHRARIEDWVVAHALPEERADPGCSSGNS